MRWCDCEKVLDERLKSCRSLGCFGSLESALCDVNGEGAMERVRVAIAVCGEWCSTYNCLTDRHIRR